MTGRENIVLGQPPRARPDSVSLLRTRYTNTNKNSRGSVMAFRMRLPSADYFADLVKAISAVVEEGTFTIDDSSMRLTSMDPAHISLVNFELSKSAAEEYSCERPVEMTVSINELYKLLRRARKNESLILEYDDEKKNLTVILANPAASTERSFTLNALESATGKTATPNLTFEARARVNADALKDAIEDASLVSDYTKVTIAPDAVMFASKGELGTHQTRFIRGGTAVYEIETDKEVSANFSLTYLEKIIKPGKSLADETVIELSTNRPIKLAFPIPSGKLEYLIAPRIE